jgi:hypothetical protein
VRLQGNYITLYFGGEGTQVTVLVTLLAWWCTASTHIGGLWQNHCTVLLYPFQYSLWISHVSESAIPNQKGSVKGNFWGLPQKYQLTVILSVGKVRNNNLGVMCLYTLCRFSALVANIQRTVFLLSSSLLVYCSLDYENRSLNSSNKRSGHRFVRKLQFYSASC